MEAVKEVKFKQNKSALAPFEERSHTHTTDRRYYLLLLETIHNILNVQRAPMYQEEKMTDNQLEKGKGNKQTIHSTEN